MLHIYNYYITNFMGYGWISMGKYNQAAFTDTTRW